VQYIELICNISKLLFTLPMIRRVAKTGGAEPPRVGDTLAALRQAQALSLDELSRKAGVSKSMLSQIERAQANPTVAVVWRLANALGVPLGELRILGPIELAGQFEWYALSLKVAGALESQAHENGTREHLTVLSGLLDVEAGDETQRLKPGETARYAVDRPHAIRNVGKTAASAWMVVVHPA
jgi:transcriptional regulator with XRE-family HTH domain